MAQRWAIVGLLVALALSFIAPVWAHTTLGDLTGQYPYRTNDTELTTSPPGNHLPGPLGYVWPGSGLNTYSGVFTYPPGYQSPFTTEEPIQAAGSSYSPEGAILTSTADHDSVGDLILALNFSNPSYFTSLNRFNYTSLAIYIPAPVFDATGKLVQDGFEPTSAINWDVGDNTNIITTITNNYGSISVTRADANDPFEPGSWVVYIAAPPGGIVFNKNFDNWYYIRINQLKAPFTAGRYFFKMFLNSSYPIHSGPSATTSREIPMPMENWPVLLVKGEVDPAIISGTIRYGPLNSTLYGTPIQLPGRIKAIGIATDPLTNQETDRPVEADGYFNATAHGHYELEGVAPGVYDIFASAAGLPEQKIASGVRVARGQSLRLDGYLDVGFQLRVTVNSKLGFGLVNWPAQRPISVLIYNSKSYDTPSVETQSPINLTNAPYTSYVNGNTYFSATGFSGLIAGLAGPKKVAFPWEGPISYYSYTDPTIRDPFGLLNGVGPAQVWWVDPRSSLDPNTGLGSSSNQFVFQFGWEDVYGVPTKLSGMVPEVFATWTDSLSPGVYYIRVFLNGYVQSNVDGTVFVDYPFLVPAIGQFNAALPLDLFQSCAVNVTVHFHDDPETIVDTPIRGPDPARYMIAEAFATDNTLSAFNFTQVAASKSEATISLNGLGMAGDPLNISPFDPRAPIKYSLARYRGVYDYGLPTDTYTVRIFMRGYIQALPPATSLDELDQPVSITVSLGYCLLSVSTHMYRGGGINATVSSTDWERPVVARNWVWNNTAVNVLVYDVASQNFIDVINFWNANQHEWMIPKQYSAFTTLPWSGWRTIFGAGASYLFTNGSIAVDALGPDLPNGVPVFPIIDPAQAGTTADFLQENFHEGFLFNFTSYRLPTFRSNLAIYPGKYALSGWTYGYVQDNVVSLGDLGNVIVAVPWLGQVADVNVKLLMGVNITLSILFKTEHIITGTPYNMSVRIRIFDNQDRLVAAATSFTADAGILYPSSDNVGFFANGKRIVNQVVPAGTTLLQYKDLAGLYSYVELSSSSLGTLGERVRAATSFSSDHGIWGNGLFSGAYDGPWTVMVDFVNWYRPSAAYPPPPALLQGESPYFFPYNHLGPYAQNGYLQIANAPLSGEASAEFEVDKRGYEQGIILGMNWDDQTRTMSWVQIELVDSTGYQYYWYSWDGWFDGYLNPGPYNMTITEWSHSEGHVPVRTSIYVNTGEQNHALNFILEESQIPIPEFTLLPIITLISISATGLLLRRRTRRQ
ncbi:MAG TPA: carboxypeptidase-like regulatory domain-containing protein [Terriglobales bacterium]|nr:carboxypeptidase-like regulatory domain-containing protein [Terriglobales bacterium]